jgi:hypothetical protein
VTTAVDDHDEVMSNGGPEMSVSVPDAHLDAAPSAPIPVQPPTEADSPL